jgi:choline monooxygenase
MQVFCDNYLDGGYHVPFAHPSLADGLDMQSYTSELCSDNMSVQRVVASATAPDRVTGGSGQRGFPLECGTIS